MEIVARLRFARISPQKCRLVADQIRKVSVDNALNILKFSPKKSAVILNKVLNSAVANAEHNEGADIDELKITQIYIDQGPTMKRIRPRAKGRANRILKRTSHITLFVGDGEV